MSGSINPISATAGAIPYLNEKGLMSMKAVKVNRYVAGKMPDYCQDETYDYNERYDENNEDDKLKMIFPDRPIVIKKSDDADADDDGNDEDMTEAELEDKRLQRLKNLKKESSTFEILNDSDSEEEDRFTRHIRERQAEMQLDTNIDGDRSDDEDGGLGGADEDNEEEMARRRQAARARALEHERESGAEVMAAFDDAAAGETGAGEDDYVEYSDEEDSGADSDQEREPKMKPVFVPAGHRRTINKSQEEMIREQEREKTRIRREEEARRARKRLIEEIKREDDAAKKMKHHADDDTDDENESESYASWKLRELRRIKRALEEADPMARQREQVARIHAMTEEERLEEFKRNPKLIVNPILKGKMKFLQRYHHRGAYYVQDLDDKVFQRDFTSPTLEDNFNMLARPKVLQVKNFGRAGRTKYTHLVDQDTTDFEAGWSKDGQNKFYNVRGGGMKQSFEKPSHSRKE